jgi:hypothetical protein
VQAARPKEPLAGTGPAHLAWMEEGLSKEVVRLVRSYWAPAKSLTWKVPSKTARNLFISRFGFGKAYRMRVTV